MSFCNSALYASRVFHKRCKPKAHKLGYRVFFLLLDLDELDTLRRRLRWFSVNSFNIFSFYDRDHGDGEDRPLREWVERELSRAGLSEAAKRIEVLSFPRVLGYVFNPITIYYCYRANGTLGAVLYEVSNTFGERHSYLARIDASPGALIRHSCAKRFFVSPFMQVCGRYHFSIRQPSNRLLVHIHQTDDDGPILDAWVRGERREIGDGALLGCLLRYPLLTLKVIWGIHFEALKLWLKGIKTQPRPQPPSEPVTLIRD